jgi:hypothetical protein
VNILLKYPHNYVLSPFQNISKSESNKFDVFGSKFGPNTFTDQLLIIFWDGESNLETNNK